MKRIIQLFTLLVCTIGCIAVAATATAAANETVWAKLKSNPETSIFAKYALELGLVDALDTAQLIIPWTLFVPDDKAFSRLPKPLLEKIKNNDQFKRQIIISHLVLGASTSVDGIGSGNKLTTASGATLNLVQKDNLYIKDAVITKKDIIATNGIIHLVECVMYVQPSVSDDRLSQELQSTYDQTACCLADSVDDNHHMALSN